MLKNPLTNQTFKIEHMWTLKQYLDHGGSLDFLDKNVSMWNSKGNIMRRRVDVFPSGVSSKKDGKIHTVEVWTLILGPNQYRHFNTEKEAKAWIMLRGIETPMFMAFDPSSSGAQQHLQLLQKVRDQIKVVCGVIEPEK